MGYFSWKCKGCGHELCEGEEVRLNGCRGTYDGFGCAGGFDAGHSDVYDPSAWHNSCYLKATPEERLDETPSEHAPNQGFGATKLEFVEKYDPEQPYIVDMIRIIVRDKSDDPMELGQKYEWYLTPTGWQDQEAWKKRAEEASDKLWEGVDYKDVDYAEMERRQHEMVGPPPEKNTKEFSDLDAAISASEEFVKGCPQASGGYSVTIFAKQENGAEGAVYEKDVSSKGKVYVENRIGHPPNELPILDTILAEQRETVVNGATDS